MGLVSMEMDTTGEPFQTTVLATKPGPEKDMARTDMGAHIPV